MRRHAAVVVHLSAQPCRCAVGTRENERQAFISTPEFGARVQAIINQEAAKLGIYSLDFYAQQFFDLGRDEHQCHAVGGKPDQQIHDLLFAGHIDSARKDKSSGAAAQFRDRDSRQFFRCDLCVFSLRTLCF